jgi:MOSC domain-containing protein YiiM
MQVVIHGLYVSPGHNFFGHHAAPPGAHPTLAAGRIQCRAGRGIEGDRFFGYRPDYAGQITFFAWETFTAIRDAFGVAALSPNVFRRNVVLAGADLNALIGARFSMGGVTFAGTGEARPCHWMNHAVAPGAEEWLKGRGGLRARVLTDGELGLGAAELVVVEKNAQPGHAAGFVGKRAVELGVERRV